MVARLRLQACDTDAKGETCTKATSEVVLAEAAQSMADAACASLMYAAQEEADACADKHGKEGSHAMGDEWMVGAAHDAGLTTVHGHSAAAATRISLSALAIAGNVVSFPVISLCIPVQYRDLGCCSPCVS